MLVDLTLVVLTAGIEQRSYIYIDKRTSRYASSMYKDGACTHIKHSYCFDRHCPHILIYNVSYVIRALFFVFWFLAYSGLVYAAGRKKKKKKRTEHERVQFLGITEHQR